MRIDLGADVNMSDVAAAARRFFAWWQSELVGLLPPSWRGAREPAMTLHVGAKSWMLATPSATLALDPAEPDAALRNAIRRELGNATHPLTVELDAASVLLRRIELPAAAASRLKNVVELQLDRLTPFRAGEAVFDYRIAERDADQILVDLAVVPRATLQTLEARLAAAGLAVRGFTVAATPFRFASTASAAEQARATRRNLVLAGIAAALWAAAFIAAPLTRDDEIADLTARITALRPEAERSAALRAEVETLRRPLALVQAKVEAPRALDMLKALTETLPDTARLIEVTMEGTRVTLTGVAADAPALIAALDASPAFQAVRFRAPVTRRPDGLDRFEIEMDAEAP